MDTDQTATSSTTDALVRLARQQQADAPQTNGGRLLMRGDSYDPECSRTTHRLRRGQALLASMGITPTWQHSDCTRVEYGRAKHACDYRCTCAWPAGTTGRTFDLAYQLADEFQTARGAQAQRSINARRAVAAA